MYFLKKRKKLGKLFLKTKLKKSDKALFMTFSVGSKKRLLYRKKKLKTKTKPLQQVSKILSNMYFINEDTNESKFWKQYSFFLCFKCL